jgi:5-(carboxyamino)imidazole ribonucleotide mutase
MLKAKPLVAVVMGSRSDWDTMQYTVKLLTELGIDSIAEVVSAHRTPDLLFRFAEQAPQKGIAMLIAGAGGAAHLPGMLAAKTPLPVIGVPIESKTLKGMDSLLSIVQMPAGIPVATMAIGQAGAINAALFSAAVLALQYPEIKQNLAHYRDSQTQAVLQDRQLELSV